MERLTTEDHELIGCHGCEEKGVCYARYWCSEKKKALIELKRYEDTGLTPQEIMELKEEIADLKEATQRLDKIFGDEITVDQVIDFFVDFYIAQCDDERVEAAELLTNEEVERYKRLKERDTAKAPVDIDEEFDMYVCPSCNMAIGAMGDREEHKFCLNCGQRLKWED